jgi:chemotaxis protein histidine kinase CheA
MKLLLPALLVLLGALPAQAQHSMDMDAMKKKMEEISQLMRESERLLRDITTMDKLVEQQRRIVDELEKLKPPEQPSNTSAQPQANEADKKKREDLQSKQKQLREKIEKLFESQDKAAQMSVQQLEWLLKNLPQGGKGPPSQSQSQGDENKPGEKKQDEKKQNGKKDGEKDGSEDKPDNGTGRDKDKAEQDKESQLSRVEAWIARLPRAQQERINRNDFSGFPPRYRRLLREYTRLRAERESRRKDDK